ncbi:MAG: phytoene desaturase [Bacteroidetes bacterium]|nr:phytoene desaturase [Bacteroidota bacterium]
MKKAVVIGSGFGGLAVANRLASRGMQVTVLEKRDKVGGRAYQFTQGGYTFDMGPSLITAPEIIEDVFRAAGRSLSDYTSLIPLDPFYRVYFHDGTSIDYSGDAEAMKEQMRQFNERDADRYDAFMAAASKVYDAVITEKLGARPFDTIKSMVDFVPRAMRLGAWKPMSLFASTFFRDFRHRFLFSFHPLFLGGNPFRSPAVYAMIPFLEKKQGVWFTPGGMYSLVQAFERLLIDQGATIETGTEVSRIDIRNGKAVGVTAGGKHYPADIVVSNSDVGHLYRDLVPAENRSKWSDSKVARTSYTMSCFLLYLGVKGTYPQLKHHTLILTKRYKELLRDIFDKKVLPDDFSMYLHVPTRTDPGMAPEGCESIYVLVPVANLLSGIDWKEEATPFADRILAYLEQWGMSELRDRIEVMKIFTPDDFESQLNSLYGNAFGVEPKLTQTAWFRPHNRSEDVSNLYLVGAGTHPGAGVPGVLLSAEATEYCICADHPDVGASSNALIEAGV